MSEAKILDTSTVKALLPDAMFVRSAQSGIDEMMQTGIYYVNSTIAPGGWPDGAYLYGVLVVFTVSVFTIQLLFTHHDCDWTKPGSGLYFRVYYSGFAEWKEWSKVNATALST